MKLMLVLCATVLIIVIIYIVAPEDIDSASDSDSASDGDIEIIRDCTVQYLKSKGIIESDTPLGTTTSLCRFALQYLARTIRNKMKTEFPDKVDCIMDDYYKLHTIDNILKMTFINDSKILSETENSTQIAANSNQLQAQMKITANSCGVEEEKFSKYLNDAFYLSEETISEDEVSSKATSRTT